MTVEGTLSADKVIRNLYSMLRKKKNLTIGCVVHCPSQSEIDNHVKIHSKKDEEQKNHLCHH